jgi:hypothetical protein
MVCETSWQGKHSYKINYNGSRLESPKPLLNCWKGWSPNPHQWSGRGAGVVRAYSKTLRVPTGDCGMMSQAVIEAWWLTEVLSSYKIIYRPICAL